MLIIIKQLAIIRIIPITKGKSTLIKASTNNFPKPFHPKIYSIKTAPESIPANQPELAVTTEDIEKVITLCLRHRLRKDPLESIDSGDKVSSVFEEVFN